MVHTVQVMVPFNIRDVTSTSPLLPTASRYSAATGKTSLGMAVVQIGLAAPLLAVGSTGPVAAARIAHSQSSPVVLVEVPVEVYGRDKPVRSKGKADRTVAAGNQGLA